MTKAARLADLSNDLADLVDRCAPGIVAVRLAGGRSVSGILWPSGHVVTAAEPTDDESGALQLVAQDGAGHEASIVARDPSTDVALLGVTGLAGAALPAADLAKLRPGQFAIAMGRSPEHGLIVSFGSVAVAGAPWSSQLGGRIDRFIRLGVTLTQAAEGSAVLDPDGRLIGMAVSGPRRSVLVIPADTIGRVVQQLLTKGRISRGYLGIAMQPVQLPEALQKLTSASVGLLVSSVDARGAAAQGGVLLGDVVVAWNGERLSDYGQVRRLLGPDSVGAAVTLGLVRGGARVDVRLTVGERPAAG